jgi:hypothetical protein
VHLKRVIVFASPPRHIGLTRCVRDKRARSVASPHRPWLPGLHPDTPVLYAVIEGAGGCAKLTSFFSHLPHRVVEALTAERHGFYIGIGAMEVGDEGASGMCRGCQPM